MEPPRLPLLYGGIAVCRRHTLEKERPIAQDENVGFCCSLSRLRLPGGGTLEDSATSARLLKKPHTSLVYWFISYITRDADTAEESFLYNFLCLFSVAISRHAYLINI